MATIDSRGLVDDGSNDLVVEGDTTIKGAATFTDLPIFTDGVTVTGSLDTKGNTAFSGSVTTIGNTQLTGSLSVKGNTTLSGSVKYSAGVGTVLNVTANSDAGVYTQVDVANLYVVPLSGSAVSASAGFAPVGMSEGQVCLFLNAAAKPLLMVGFSDSSTMYLSAGVAGQALYFNTSWHRLSGSV